MAKRGFLSGVLTGGAVGALLAAVRSPSTKRVASAEIQAVVDEITSKTKPIKRQAQKMARDMGQGVNRLLKK